MEAEEGSDHGEGIDASAPVPEPNISARDGASPEGTDATDPRTVPVLGMLGMLGVLGVLGMGHKISCACAGDGGGLR